MSKSRKLIGALLALTFVACCVFLLSLGADARRSFLGEYGRNLDRLVRGQWHLAELRDPVRVRDGRGNRRSNGNWSNRYRSGPEIFAKLDGDGNARLSTEEMGVRIAARHDGQEPVDLDVFQRIIQQNWSPPTNPSHPEKHDELVHDEAHDATDPTDEASLEKIQHVLNADDLLDSRQVMQVHIELADDDWRTLCHQSRSHQSARENPLDKPYTNFRGSVTINGVRIDDVAIRKKGFIGSQDTVRPSLKIKFDEYVDQDPIVGLDRLTLNNNKQDRALVSQLLTYFLFRKAGIDAPRSTFAAVSVNNRYLGVYSHVESVKKPFLARVYGDDSGKLYEGTLTDLYPKSIEWIEAKTTPSDEDRMLITQLARVLHDDSSTIDELAAIVDLPVFLRYWAMESLINFWDGYSQNQNNYFLSENPSNGLIYFLPWGADSCFGNRPRFVQRSGEHAEAVRATGILANKLYHLPGIPDQYRLAMLDLLEQVWDEDELLGEIARAQTLLRDHIDINQIEAVVAADDVRRFIRSRRETLLEELNHHWPASVADEPRIPQYREVVGKARGTFERDTDQVLQLEVAMELEGKSIPLTEIELGSNRMHLRDNSDDAGFEVELRWNADAQDNESKYQLSGEILYPIQPRHEIQGTLKLTFDRSIPIQGEFDFVICERRGGRW